MLSQPVNALLKVFAILSEICTLTITGLSEKLNDRFYRINILVATSLTKQFPPTVFP